MELRHLRYFIAVAEERNFSRAAARLNMSQPPLSRQIADLEARLGVMLFKRTSREVSLTPAGQAFLPRARAVLFETQSAEEEARRLAHGWSETLTLGFMSAIMLAKFHLFLEPFHRRYPGVALRLKQLRSDEQLAAVLDERIDVGFVDLGVDIIRDRLNSHKISVQPFLREELCAVLPLGHPLGDRSELRLADLRDETFALLERHLFPAHHDTVIALCRAAGFAPRIQHTGEQIPTVLTYVAARMAICIAPRLAEPSWDSLVRFVPLNGRPFIDIHMISRVDTSRKAVVAMQSLVSDIARGTPAA